MNILVIGATGYIGGAVAAAAARAGHDVAALRHPGGHGLPDNRRQVEGDLRDPASLTAAAEGFDRVVHAGPPLGEEIDLAGVDALVAAGVPLVYTTGAAVLGPGWSDEDSDPDPHPLISWRGEAERRVLAAGGHVVRPGLAYGDGGGLVAGLLAREAAERGVGVYIGEPGVRLPVVHVEDLAALYVAVLGASGPGRIWHGMSENVRLDEVAAVLGGGEAVSWPLEEARAEVGPAADLFTLDQVVDSAKTRDLLGWRPARTSLLDWLREHR
ncbi:NAD-dependent epimerase/dehydratase family protein [Bailinhaonella thermotolerans]|uniref:NAD-dependent epimerase/dehydratase family protein n=1 Tax=Bailinhaonella thermotolerans TaxID=1070861 RepID=A0A3A4AMM5_9ACTN|nr:NAD-dependent epimerase/dehydratase family protein [Bailinhaonella thermotolerans]RJL27063.1 NAD-dependent epimerase/dehydratase family protein [Bailinhaonella thermotolerans]